MANEPSAPRRRLSKGVLIRLAIYVPLLGFFGWRAADKAIAERDASDDVFRQDLDRLLENPPGMIDLSKMIPVDSQAELSAPAGFKPADEGGTTTSGTTTGEPADATSTGTTSTSTTGEPADATSTSTAGTTSTSGAEPTLEPAATSTTTSTGP